MAVVVIVGGLCVWVRFGMSVVDCGRGVGELA